MAKTHWHPLADLTAVTASAPAAANDWLSLLADQPEEVSPQRFLERALAEVAARTRAHWIALLRREADWQVVHQIGSLPGGRRLPPLDFLAEVCDRGQAALREADAHHPLYAALPLDPLANTNELLALSSSEAKPDGQLLNLLATAATRLARGLALCRRLESLHSRVAQLESLLDVARRLSAIRETEPLLVKLAEEATRLLLAERASIFLWDRPSRQLVARPALGVDAGELRVPDHQGIVGRVVQEGQPVRIDDAYAAPEFNREVDRRLGYRTRNLLCVPLFSPEGQCLGAFEVLNKKAGAFRDEDVETLTQLAAQAAIALESAQEREQLVQAQRQMTEQAAQGVQLIGPSPAMEAMRSTIRRVAATDLPVLILGESGTGKEVVSRAIHLQGSRRDRPFLPVNCAALTETLLESELFGHEKGAFTDAREMRQGKFELASTGTLFLDEIGDLSPGGQAKLLRVLEEKVVYRVGGSQAIHTDARVLAATNRDLAEAVQERKFRQDLFFRLSVVTLSLPPLRDRREDILPLAEHFLEQFCRDARRKKLKFSAEARRRLQEHAWPGNVRELRNLMERLAFLAPGPAIEAGELTFLVAAPASVAGQGFLGPSALAGKQLALAEATDRFQEDYIKAAISKAQGNMTDAARLLGLHRSNLYRKMRQLGMDADVNA